MKRLLIIGIIVCGLIVQAPAIAAEPGDGQAAVCGIMEQHGAVMLLIDPDTGSILFANDAAADFYGYDAATLQSMNIQEINTLSPQETDAEMQTAIKNQRNYFVFRHRLASDEIRTVEVYSYPVRYGEQRALYSIIHDVTEKVMLEQRQQRIYDTVIIAGSIVIILLLLLILVLKRNQKTLRLSKEKIENFDALRKTFINADERLVYLKDENLRYVFVNQALENFYQRNAGEIIGHDDFALSVESFARKRRDTDLAVLKHKTRMTDEVVWADRIYKTNKFPIRMINGQYGVGAYIEDITEARENEKKRIMALYRHKIIADVLTHSFQSGREELDYVLHEALKITESAYGYIYLYDEAKQEFILNSWSRGVMEDCSVAQKQTRYSLINTGIWGEVVRQGKPIVVNDFEAPNSLKKGYPQGHVRLQRFMSIPVIIDGEIVAAVGLANKPADYDDNDVYEMTLLMNSVWHAIERKRSQDELLYARNKYLQTLLSIGDGVMVVDRDGHIEMLNAVAEKLTGWSLDEASGKHYKEVFVLSHEREGASIDDPIEGVLATDTIQELGNHAVLTSRNGTRYFLEDSAAPIKDNEGKTDGVILVFRDVTDKKKQRERIEYLSYHDPLTGLSNRMFFEEELRRVNKKSNLPLSVIMGDVNGLKLTNDVFGHPCGDKLLIKVAEVFSRILRPDDVAARWGGDEFIVLLPSTGPEEAEEIVRKIKELFSRERIKAIQGSISLGYETKFDAAQDIEKVLDSAEEKMYFSKAMEREKLRDDVIASILSGLGPTEKDHADRVSGLCQDLGRSMGLPEVDIGKLREAGYLHDIGKIILDPKIRSKSQLSDREWHEVKRHPIIGYRILNGFDDTLDLAELVLAHHERWDGSGYPKGLRGKAIPLLARILSVVETYDRMTHDLDASLALERDEAIRVLQKNAGAQFDPGIVEAFSALVMEDKG